MRTNTAKRNIRAAVSAAVVLSIIWASTVSAVSYQPHLYHQEERHDKFTKGDTIYLFQSGTDDVKKTIHPGDILTVYRISPSCEIEPVGLIRVLSYVGDTYLKGEVFAGEIKPDDIAKKGDVSCLVISVGMCDHEK